MQYSALVEMDGRDVTKWVRGMKVSLVENGFRAFELRFSAWHSFDKTSTFDIYESLNPATSGYQTILVRRGMMAPDLEPLVTVERDIPPYIIVTGYELAWFAQRKRPHETIVLAPSTANVQDQIQVALEDYAKQHPGRSIGQIRVWRGLRTIGDAVRALLRAAGMNVSYRLPDHPLVPYVMDPSLSYWSEAVRLTDPWAPVRYYQRWTNTLVIQDATQPIMGDGPPLNIPASEMRQLQAVPRVRATPRRVIVRIPPWR